MLQALLEQHDGPLLSTTLFLPDSDEPLHDVSEVSDLLDRQVAGVIDSGACPHLPTTVVDLTPMGKGDAPELVRQGAGDASILGL